MFGVDTKLILSPYKEICISDHRGRIFILFSFFSLFDLGTIRRIVSHGTCEIIKGITPNSSNLRLGAFVREEKAGKGVREMEEETRAMRPLSGDGKRGTVWKTRVQVLFPWCLKLLPQEFRAPAPARGNFLIENYLLCFPIRDLQKS